MKILIAGGTGLIGQALTKKLTEKHHVNILSRSKHQDQPSISYYQWDIKKKEIELKAFDDVEVLINLSGAGIADKKWSTSRKKVLIDSRVEPNNFLLETIKKNNIELKNFICSSGISCYGWENRDKIRTEEDDYGTDFLSHVVKLWEQSAQNFTDICPVHLVRTSVVLSPNGGALQQLSSLVKKRMGSKVGSGKQYMPWIHIDDMTNIFIHLLKHKQGGVFNVNADEQVSNKAFMKTLNQVLNKKPWAPPTPSWTIKLLMGEMSEMILEGVKVSNDKIKKTGFQFQFEKLKPALQDIYSQ